MKPLNAMDIGELLTLKTKVEAAITTRVKQERRRLEESLKKLDEIAEQPPSIRQRRSNGHTNGHSKANGHAKRKSLAPKYRNPANARETWAGRGLKPRWLNAALKGGKRKLSDFEI
jgi:DNA-binding protein H-NS